MEVIVPVLAIDTLVTYDGFIINLLFGFISFMDLNFDVHLK